MWLTRKNSPCIFILIVFLKPKGSLKKIELTAMHINCICTVTKIIITSLSINCTIIINLNMACHWAEKWVMKSAQRLKLNMLVVKC